MVSSARLAPLLGCGPTYIYIYIYFNRWNPVAGYSKVALPPKRILRKEVMTVDDARSNLNMPDGPWAQEESVIAMNFEAVDPSEVPKDCCFLWMGMTCNHPSSMVDRRFASICVFFLFCLVFLLVYCFCCLIPFLKPPSNLVWREEANEKLQQRLQSFREQSAKVSNDIEEGDAIDMDLLFKPSDDRKVKDPKELKACGVLAFFAIRLPFLLVGPYQHSQVFVHGCCKQLQQTCE